MQQVIKIIQEKEWKEQGSSFTAGYNICIYIKLNTYFTDFKIQRDTSILLIMSKLILYLYSISLGT